MGESCILSLSASVSTGIGRKSAPESNIRTNQRIGSSPGERFELCELQPAGWQMEPQIFKEMAGLRSDPWRQPEIFPQVIEKMVDLGRIELPTSSLRTMRSPS
jgi:hypothetical protein